MSGRVEVALLGASSVAVDGRSVAVSGIPQRTVLARLALSPERPVSDAALLDALWPMDPPPNATGNLQSYVSRLRRALGADVVGRAPNGYVLHIPTGQIDVFRFAQLVEQAQLEVGSDPRRAAATFGQALALWRGEPFADVADPHAFLPDRARLEVLHHDARIGALDAQVAAGDAVRALPDLERSAAADPTDEAAHLVLIRALHLLGRSADALRTASELRARMIDATGLDPSPRLADLERRVLEDDPTLLSSAPAPAPAPKAPAGRPAAAARLAPRNRFVGRTAELDAVAAALGDGAIVTVVGPGGAGKTRLVQELIDRGSAGTAIVVELAPVTTDADVVGRIAATLGIQAAPAGVEDAIADQLAGRTATLVLDNCEHVALGAAAAVRLAQGASAGIGVVATSRVRLGVPGEQVIRLGPLAAVDQARLFCDRAALQRPDFTADGADAAVIASICDQLDGLPLALELAASREAVFGLDQLGAQLARGLDVIEPAEDDGGRGVVATVEWSYRLLRPPARALFDRLAVCRGGFSLDALDHLAPDAGPTALSELVDASLVEVDLTARPPRYRQLEVMRRVALGHLDADELVAARKGHLRWMVAHAAACIALQPERTSAASELLRRELANVIAALGSDRVEDREEIAILAATVGVLSSDDPQVELSDQLRRLERWTEGTDEPAALCALGCGAAAWLRGDTQLALALLDRAVAGFPIDHPLRFAAFSYRIPNALFMGDLPSVESDARTVLDDPSAPAWAQAAAAGCAALINCYRGDLDAAHRWTDRHEALLDQVGEVDAFIPFVRAELLATEDPAGAVRRYEEAAALAARNGQTYNQVIAGVGKASALLRLERLDDAAAACAETVALAARIGMWPQAWTTLRVAADVLARRGEPSLAAVVLTAGSHDVLAPEVLEIDQPREDRVWAAIRTQLSEDEVAGAQRLAARLDRPELVARTIEALA